MNSQQTLALLVEEVRKLRESQEAMRHSVEAFRMSSDALRHLVEVRLSNVNSLHTPPAQISSSHDPARTTCPRCGVSLLTRNISRHHLNCNGLRPAEPRKSPVRFDINQPVEPELDMDELELVMAAHEPAMIEEVPTSPKRRRTVPPPVPVVPVPATPKRRGRPPVKRRGRPPKAKQ